MNTLTFGFSFFLAVFFIYFVRGYDPGFGWTIAMLVMAIGILFSLPKKLSEYPLHTHREGYVLLGAGCCLAISHSIWDQKHFVVLNVLLTFPLLVAGGYALSNHITHLGEKLFSFLSTGLSDFFHSCFKYLGSIYDLIPTFSKTSVKKEHFSRFTPQVGLSIVTALFLIGILILPLLASADPIFSKLLENSLQGFFDLFSFDVSFDWLASIDFGKIILGCIIATLTGGAMKLLSKQAILPTYESRFHRINDQNYNIIITMITVVYVLFACIQIKYLFLGGTLPDGVTYSEYAVKGFRQLLAILAINVMIFVISPLTGEKKSYSFILNGILFLATCVIWVSCVMRLQLYIDVYQLTRMRLLPWTFSILLFILMTLVYLGTQKSSISRMQVCLYGVLLWYVSLNLVGVDWIIAKYNRSHTQESILDTQYLLNELSQDVFYVLDESYRNLSTYDRKEIFNENTKMMEFIPNTWQEMNLSRLLHK